MSPLRVMRPVMIETYLLEESICRTNDGRRLFIKWSDEPDALGFWDLSFMSVYDGKVVVTVAALERWLEALISAECPDPDQWPAEAEAHLAALDEISDVIGDRGTRP